MHRGTVLFALCLAAAALPRAAAQQPAEERESELAALVDGLGDTPGPGGVLAVLRSGEPTFVRAFGLADVEAKAPVTPQTRFYLASVAKAFTGACILHAAEAGKLALDDSLGARVSGGPEAWKSVRLRDLLAHRGGVTDVYDLAIGLDLGPQRIADNGKALALIRRVPQLDFEPGTRLCYSNSGYVLLAEALRAATGQDLAAYASSKIFVPLDMAGAGFAGDSRVAKLPHARGYRDAGSGWQPTEPSVTLLGPGGLWASLDDLARWERALFTGKWGSESLRRELMERPALAPGATGHPLFGDSWAGSHFATDRGLAVVRMAGEAWGFQAEILRYPEPKVTVVVLANADLGLDGLAEDAAGIVLRDALHPDPEPEAFAGFDARRIGRFWREEDSGVLWVVKPRDGHAVAISLGDWNVEVVPVAPDRAVSRGARASVELRFEPESGPATRMLVSADGREVVACRPHAYAPVEAAALEECAGEYELAALDVRLAFRAGPAGLEMVQQRPLAPEFQLPPFQPLGGDLFACDAGAQLQFLRDEQGRVVGARMDTNRARGIMLERRAADAGG